MIGNVAISVEPDLFYIPRREIRAGIDLVSRAGGMSLQLADVDFRHFIRSPEPSCIVYNTLTLPRYGPLTLHTTKRDIVDTVEGKYLCGVACDNGAAAINIAESPTASKEVVAHELYHLLTISKLVEIDSSLHCDRPDCIMYPDINLCEEGPGLLSSDPLDTSRPFGVSTRASASTFCESCKFVLREVGPEALARYESTYMENSW